MNLLFDATVFSEKHHAGTWVAAWEIFHGFLWRPDFKVSLYFNPGIPLKRIWEVVDEFSWRDPPIYSCSGDDLVRIAPEEPTRKTLRLKLLELFDSKSQEILDLQNRKSSRPVIWFHRLVRKSCKILLTCLPAGKPLTEDKLPASLDSFYSPVFAPPEFLRRKYPHIKRYGLLLNVTPILFPECFPSSFFENGWYADLMNTIRDDRDARWIAISEATRRDYLKYVPELAPDRITTALLAADARFRPRRSSSENERIRRKYNIPRDAKYVFFAVHIGAAKKSDRRSHFVPEVCSGEQYQGSLLRIGRRKFSDGHEQGRGADQKQRRPVRSDYSDRICGRRRPAGALQRSAVFHISVALRGIRSAASGGDVVRLPGHMRSRVQSPGGRGGCGPFHRPRFAGVHDGGHEEDVQ